MSNAIAKETPAETSEEVSKETSKKISKEARFAWWFLAFVLGSAAVIATLDIVADPYLVFGLPRIGGFNARKPAAFSYERWMKAYDAPRHAATTMILGSSRSGLGFDPAAGVWPDSAQPVYNLSLAGSKTREDLRYLQHVFALTQESARPKKIVVGLDIEYFFSPPERARVEARSRPGRGGEDEERMATLADGSPNPARRLRLVKDYLTATLSLDALAETVAMIVDNRRARAEDLEANGHLSETRFQTIIGYDGAGRLFDENNGLFVRSFGLQRQVLDRILTEDAIDGVLGFAKQHGLQVVLYVQPTHADRLEMLDRFGYWNDVETWKREITRLVDAQRRDGVAVELWDFAGYEPYEREPVPDDADRKARLQWFWEPGHYTTRLGNRMIGRMMSSDHAGDFGVELTPETIEARIAQVRVARKEYRDGAPAEAARLDKLICARMSCPQPRLQTQAAR